MNTMRQSKVLSAAAIAMLVLAVANVAVVVGNWPVSRSVSQYGFLVLGAGVFALLYRVEPESFRPPAEGKFGFWGTVCAMVVLGGGSGLVASIVKPQGTSLVVGAVAVVAMGVALGWFVETHVAPWHHPTTEE
jgi:hypothetical protein